MMERDRRLTGSKRGQRVSVQEEGRRDRLTADGPNRTTRVRDQLGVDYGENLSRITIDMHRFRQPRATSAEVGVEGR